VRRNDEVGEFARSFNIMADKVQEHIEELSEMSESKERFINDLSHEMRTPITAIAGHAEMLKIGNLNATERERSLDYIISQSRRVQSMTYKLNELARMSGGYIGMGDVDVGAVVASVRATCGEQLSAKGIAFGGDVSGVTVRGDAALMESLMQNLVENAIRASEPGGKIDVLADRAGDGEVVITVTDFGKGIAKDELSKIKEPFYRVDKSRTRADGGVGLGLAICARICEVHGARIEIESEPGEGTKIKLHFTTPQQVDADSDISGG
jgi:signal transduction histidine kinase